MSWLNEQTARELAFNYRFQGTPSSFPVLITDFDIKNLRVFQVTVPSESKWNDIKAWTVTERPMTDFEFGEINTYAGGDSYTSNMIDEIICGYKDDVIRINGYVKRPTNEHYKWQASIDIDEVKAKYGDAPCWPREAEVKYG